jgi:hypothetical protein
MREKKAKQKARETRRFQEKRKQQQNRPHPIARVRGINMFVLEKAAGANPALVMM